jgi:hypothetical protein
MPWVGAVVVVELLELAQGVEQVLLVPDQDAVEQFPSAGQHPVGCQKSAWLVNCGDVQALGFGGRAS